MRKLVNKLTASKKFNKYCINMLKMYNYGRVNMPVQHSEKGRIDRDAAFFSALSLAIFNYYDYLCAPKRKNDNENSKNSNHRSRFTHCYGLQQPTNSQYRQHIDRTVETGRAYNRRLARHNAKFRPERTDTATHRLQDMLQRQGTTAPLGGVETNGRPYQWLKPTQRHKIS